MLCACGNACLLLQVVNRWLSVRLELMGACVVFSSAITVAVVFPRNAGLAGLALTSALNLTGTTQCLHRGLQPLFAMQPCFGAAMFFGTNGDVRESWYSGNLCERISVPSYYSL